ncbi:hypothetical protein HNR23_004816 [Nocardiopsis mwathae]|uniref:Uncharacterized protein n=1 Tax=Nocardiopsis mwathae TaxID=1472723 RepID=A0A7X0D8H6_9ACTN|nr:hypothetical protein [Nocardiopsis mwathae]MBB6174756.1 hypothetical protein [Nocardiopsis mwathae]
MGVLLLVRSSDGVTAAVEQAGAFLLQWRRRFPDACADGELLGVWLRRELGSGLPAWRRSGRDAAPGVRVNDCRDPYRPGRGVGHDVGIRESLTCADTWALCWVDGGWPRGAAELGQRRRRILDGLVCEADGPGLFLPVFGAGEATGGVGAAMRELQGRYPRLVGDTWFVDDRRHGILRFRGR